MARREPCSGCGLYQLVPLEAQTIRCSRCHAITHTIAPVPSNARPNRNGNHVHGSSIGPGRTSCQRFGYDSYPQPRPPLSPVSVHGGKRALLCGVNYHGKSYKLKGCINDVKYIDSCQRFGYDSYPQPRPPLSHVSVHGGKRALLCGVNYHGKSYKLKGCINDVKVMRYLLVEKMGFPNDSIVMLTEDEGDPSKIPTKQNIRRALRWLVDGCQSGDSLVFHFSGHGTRQRDFNHDEVDGYDEALCPLDHETEGNIIDDEINDTIVKPLPRGATLHAIIDASYSGTVLDLPFVCRMNNQGFYMWEDQRNPLFFMGTSGGLACCFSACDDNQTSVETTAFTRTKARAGAMTSSFVQAVRNEPILTYGSLLNAMRKAIRDVEAGLRLNGPVATPVDKVLFGATTQEPQLTSSEKFSIYSKRFVL